MSLSISKTTEPIPFDSLLVLTRTAFGLGLGMLWLEEQVEPRGGGDDAGPDADIGIERVLLVPVEWPALFSFRRPRALRRRL